ncbi:DMT family transporter [Aestuariivirga sp.]|jgi:drug/metabolite transporter (DMT)-like permease|uniref:DMT family transporter n=1 Tax=Aestuariivirga sp. TaxID=2650926 RepID=UPI0037841604
MINADHRQHQIGLLLVAAAALAWSTSALFVRNIEAGLMTMLFWRGIFSGTAVFLLFFLMERGAALSTLRTLRWPTLVVALLSATGMITGIGALRNTTAADAMVIYATVPFMTAALAYMVIGEKPSSATLIASTVALLGVGVMLLGADLGGSLLGQCLAVMMAFSMAAFTTVMRQHRNIPMLPAMAASAWICSFGCYWFAEPSTISSTDLMLCMAFGIVQNAAGLALYAFGSKRVPAAEATLLAALEVPLTPFWVFLFMGETPSPQTLIGGSIVLLALFFHILAEFRRRPAAMATPVLPP